MLKREELNKLRLKYQSNGDNKIKQRILNKVSLVDLLQDSDTELEQQFNINIKTHNVIDQKSSGRCWSFAGLNILISSYQFI